MTKKILTISIISILIILGGCQSSNKSEKQIVTQSTNKYLDANVIKEITWDEMIKEINKAEYVSIGQSHNLDVLLVLSNGITLKAKEPKIDAMLDVVKNCKKCQDKPILSE